MTEVSPAGPFWEAEPEHQDYLEKNPNGYTCHFIRPDWKLPARKDADRSRVERRRGVNSESTTMGPYEGVMLTLLSRLECQRTSAADRLRHTPSVPLPVDGIVQR